MLRSIMAVLSAVLIALTMHYENVFTFGPNAAEYYLESASSSCGIENSDTILREPLSVLFVKGGRVKGVTEEFVKEFLKSKNARDLFEEHVDGIASKYYYSSKISGYKVVNGKKINIHTVETEGGFSIGVPAVFGSY